MPTLDEAIELASGHVQAGRLAEGEALCRQILAQVPNQPDSLHLLGVIALSTGHLEAAAELMAAAALAVPGNGAALSNLGEVLRQLKRWDEAAAALERAMVLAPDLVSAPLVLGLSEMEAGRLDRAAAALDRAAALDPGNPLVWRRRGRLADARGDARAAWEAFSEAARLAPDSDAALFDLAFHLHDKGKAEEAVPLYRRVLAVNPGHGEAAYNLALALERLERPQEAIAQYRVAIAMAPHRAASHMHPANLLCDDNPAEAEIHFRQARSLDPFDANIPYNLTRLLKADGRWTEAREAIEDCLRLDPIHADGLMQAGVVLACGFHELDAGIDCFRRALAVRPDFPNCTWNLGVIQLLAGDYAEGWSNYERRFLMEDGIAAARHFDQPRWRGEPLAGRTLLVHAEQGMGDTIMFARFLPRLAVLGGRVVLEVQPPLMALLAGLPGVDEMVPDGAPLPPFDLECPMMSLVAALGIGLDGVGMEAAYLSPPGVPVTLPGTGRPRVGLCWRGAKVNKAEKWRSPGVSPLGPLLAVDGVDFLPLIPGGREELANAFPQAAILDLGHDIDAGTAPFLETAALMRDLDLIVTSDTSIANLAGALGLTAWVMLPFTPDWRWLLGRDDSPWYPSLRLFRQDRFGDWNGVMGRLADELEQWVGRLTHEA